VIMRVFKGCSAAMFGAVLLLALASPAGATTIGQLAPGSSPAAVCGGAADDRLQPTVTSGTPYVVPPFGATITSWSTNAAANAGQKLKFKVFRLVSGLTYTVVAHDTHDLTGGSVNTFPTDIAVKPGDVIGATNITSATVSDACYFSVPGETFLFRSGSDLPDGTPGAFTTALFGARINISAVVKPLNTFTLGNAARNKKKGTATIAVTVPGPGSLAVSGASLKSTQGAATTPGTVTLLLKARGKAKKKLRSTGKAKVKAAVTYAPAGGDPRTQSLVVKLKKKLS